MNTASVFRGVTTWVGFAVALAALARHAGAADPPSPDPAEARLREVLAAKLVPPSYVFSGPALPRFDFEQPSRARELIGAYAVETTYYDRGGRRVESAGTSGPYRAVVRVVPKASTSRPFRRFVTLFRTEAPLAANWKFGADPAADMNRLVGDPASPYGPMVRDQIKGAPFATFSQSPGVASLLAGVSEHRPGDRLFHNAQDAVAVDRQRWVTLKPALYEAFPTRRPFTGPRPIEGAPATVLHVGTRAEAGFKPGSVEAIDAVCRAWAADSDQAFAVCVARHGVVVLHKGYGVRDGRPMTVDTPSWMASVTKTMSACLMMMLVDQGLVDLDAPAETYLPALRGLKSDPTLTVRHLYTHTSGLDKWPNWADNMPDVEERVAESLDRLKPGREWVYNPTGYVLGGKIIENLTGEAVPNFFRNHLLDQLGCPRTEVYGTHADTYSVPLDMARLGQMLLNRGAYGSWRFFSEETFDKMIPRRLTTILGADTKKVFGIGLDGIPERIGHGTASSATFQVDRANDLVIILTRNTAGTNWEKYQGRFIEAIKAGLVPPFREGFQ